MQKTVTEFLSDLSYGPLASLAIGQGSIGMVRPGDEPRLVSLINKGLVELHSRFILKENELGISFDEDRYRYPLTSEAIAASDGSYENVVPSYIINNVNDPFDDDVIKVLSVWTHDPCDLDDLIELPLNDEDDLNSVFVVNSQTVQIRNALQGQVFYIIYQASHPKVSVDDLDAPITLPPFLWEALEAWVASRVLRGMSGEAHLTNASVYQAQFEAICIQAEERDLISTGLYSTKSTFEERGWR